jgi:hypothetical protein
MSFRLFHEKTAWGSCFMAILMLNALGGCVKHNLEFERPKPFVAPIPNGINLSEELTLDAPTLPPGVKFVPKPGTSDSVTIDGVTVQVTSIADLGGFRSEFLKTIKLPNGKDFSFCLIPRLASMRVTNATDHIITLGQNMMLAGTIVHLEDETGKAYPLMNDWDAIKADAINALEEYNQKCQANMKAEIAELDAKADKITAETADFGKKELDEYASLLQGDYATRHEETMHRVQKLHWCRLLEVFWWLPVPVGLLVEDNPIKNPGFCLNSNESGRLSRSGMEVELYRLSPQSLLSGARKDVASVLQSQVFAKIDSARTNLSESISDMSSMLATTKEAATQEMANIQQPDDIVLNGAYQPIIILPGRSREVFVPFKKPAKDKEINEMNVYVIDLVTMMDAAGIPTKRGTFKFTMVPEIVTPVSR